MTDSSPNKRKQTLESLIDHIYDTALAPQQWPATLNAIAGYFSAGAAVIQGYDKPDRNHLFSITTANIADAEDEYVAHYHPIDPRLDWALRHPNESLLYDYRHIDEAGIRKSAYYDWFEQYLGLRYYLAHRISNTPTGGMLVSLQFTHSHGHVQQDKIEAFSQLRPHLLRAVRMARMIEARNAQHEAIDSVLQGLSLAVFMLDSQARVIHANTAGERVLARRDGLQLHAHQLCAADSYSTAALRNALRQAVTGPNAGTSSTPAELSINRPSGAIPYSVMVLPQTRRPIFSSATSPHCAAIVLVNDNGEYARLARPLLQQTFGLTSAELRVCELLADGRGAETISERLGIAESTARTHIKRILAKTGFHRQPELVALLGRLRRRWH